MQAQPVVATRARGSRALGWARLALALAPLLVAWSCAGDSDLTPAPSDSAGLPALLGAAAPQAGQASITEAELRAEVEYLASPELAGRRSGQGGDELAARSLAAELRAAGLAPEPGQADLLQRLSISSGRGYTWNVIGYLPGTEPAYRDAPLVVGAHYDHTGATSSTYYPGADDNASGAALVVEVAEAFQAGGAPPRRPILFAAFGAEELGLVGSYQWVGSRFGYGLDGRPLFMINADMVGHLATGRLRVLGVDSHEALADALRAISQRQGLSDPIFSASAGGGSDHVPFQALGVPVAFFHTGVHADYHTPRDLPATLDFPGLTTTAHIVYELAWNLANAKRLPALPEPSGVAPGAFGADHDLVPFGLP